MLIYCPKCENECSKAEKVCPKCGHELRRRGWWRRQFGPGLTGQDAVYAEIGTLRIVGIVVIAIGMFGLCWGAIHSERRELCWVGLWVIWSGFLTRCLAGIWATLERIAQK